MRLYKHAALMELRYLAGKEILFILALFLACLFFLQKGVNNFTGTMNQQKVFQEIEREKVKLYSTYTQYGTYGVRIMAVPDPMSVFFIDSCVMPDTHAYMDSGERLKIYNSLKGKNLFLLKRNNVTDFAGILLIVGGLLALLYGHRGFLPVNYLKFLVSVSNRKKIYRAIILPRVFIMALLYSLLFAAARFQLWFNGIILPLSGGFMFFFLAGFLVLLFFFSLGAFTGALPFTKRGLLLPIGLWLLIGFIIPTVIDFHTAERANAITPEYRLDNKKLKTVMGVEKKAIENNITFKYGEKLTNKVKDFVKNYSRNEFVELGKYEECLHNEMRDRIEGYHTLTMFCPSSYFRSVSGESSSRGFLNYLDFSEYTRRKKEEFFKFYMDKLYFSSNFSKIENFIKGTENIYHTKPRLPHTFWHGLVFTVFLIALFLGLAYHGFSINLYSLPAKEAGRVNPKKLKLKSGNVEACYSTGDLMPNLLYILFSGKGEKLFKKGFRFQLSLDDKDLVNMGKDVDFIYVCDTDSLPGKMRCGDFILLLCSLLKVPCRDMNSIGLIYIGKDDLERKISELQDYQQGELLLLPLRFNRCRTCLVNDTGKDKPIEFIILLKDHMEELAGQGASVLYITTEDGLPNPRSIKDQPVLLIPSPYWKNKVEYLKKQVNPDYQVSGQDIQTQKKQ